MNNPTPLDALQSLVSHAMTSQAEADRLNGLLAAIRRLVAADRAYDTARRNMDLETFRPLDDDAGGRSYRAAAVAYEAALMERLAALNAIEGVEP